MLSKRAQDRFTKCYFMIVPDVHDDSDKDEVLAWQAMEPKEYKIKIVNRDAPLMRQGIGNIRQDRWCDIDGERFEFKTSFRPRARYLFYAYCETSFRLSFIRKRLAASQDESNTRFWGVPGPYMRKVQLLGFVEEMGDQYKHLLEGAIEESRSEPTTQHIAARITHSQSATKDVDWRKDVIDDGNIDDSGPNNKHDEEDGEEWEIVTAAS